MKTDDLQEYFDLFIIKYLPYKDKEIYQRIIQFLLNYYLKHSYEDIPAEFKSLFEERLIPAELYDSLLLSNGFPDYIINRLGPKQKEILLRTFMDFNRYKGTLLSIEMISDNFDSFNIYELFIDFRDDRWVFIPYMVYQNIDIPDRMTGTVLEYEPVVNKTKHFLISEDNLNHLKDNNNILLPIKSNLILIDYNTFIDYQSINQLYAAIILNHFQDHRINLYFQDGIYQTSFKKFYFLWHYVFHNFYYSDTNETIFPNLVGAFISYNYSRDLFPFKLTDLAGLTGNRGIHGAYRKLKRSPAALYEFKKQYFDKFQDFLMDTQVTGHEMDLYAQQSLPSDLFTYIDNRLKNKNIIELDAVLDELYNSVITWKYAIESEIETALYYRKKKPSDSVKDIYMGFIDNFISNLPLLNIKIQNSVTYLLLHHFKPYHTELIFNDIFSLMRVKDQFNSVFNDEKNIFSYSNNRITLAHPSYNCMFSYFSKPYIDQIQTSDNSTYLLNLVVNESSNYTYHFDWDMTYYPVSLAHISYNYNFIYVPPSN